MKDLEPVFAIGLVGLVPEDPTPENTVEMLNRLGPCPVCGGAGRFAKYAYDMNGIDTERVYTICTYCHGVKMLLWMDGLQYYEEHAHTATDTMLALRDNKVRDWIKEGLPLEEVWKQGVDNYGFHLWRVASSLEQPRPIVYKKGLGKH